MLSDFQIFHVELTRRRRAAQATLKEASFRFHVASEHSATSMTPLLWISAYCLIRGNIDFNYVVVGKRKQIYQNDSNDCGA